MRSQSLSTARSLALRSRALSLANIIGDGVVAQSSYEGRRFPVAVGRVIDQPLAFLAASARSRHLRVRAGFINENQSLGIKRRLRLSPVFALLGHVFVVLFAGVQRFFYSSACGVERTARSSCPSS